jgi:hypothetical protein
VAWLKVSDVKLDASINVVDRFGVVEEIGENSPFPIGA